MNTFSRPTRPLATDTSPVASNLASEVIDLSLYALTPIGEDGEFVVCRGSPMASTAQPASVLVVMPSAEHPRPECVQMLGTRARARR